MKITKVILSREDWVVEVKGRQIPLDVFRIGALIILIYLFISMAYNVGVYDALMLAGYNPEGNPLNPFQKAVCIKMVDGNKVTYDCQDIT